MIYLGPTNFVSFLICHYFCLSFNKRPGVDGAVLEKPSLIHWVIKWLIRFLQIFKTSSLQNLMSLGPAILEECSPPSMCHMSNVTCHMSRVTCHVSHVTCHVSHVLLVYKKKYKAYELVGRGSVINGAYPV